jgi:hypothetical protein
VLPVGLSDTPGDKRVVVFCPVCEDVYSPALAHVVKEGYRKGFGQPAVGSYAWMSAQQQQLQQQQQQQQQQRPAPSEDFAAPLLTSEPGGAPPTSAAANGMSSSSLAAGTAGANHNASAPCPPCYVEDGASSQASDQNPLLDEIRGTPDEIYWRCCGGDIAAYLNTLAGSPPGHSGGHNNRLAAPSGAAVARPTIDGSFYLDGAFFGKSFAHVLLMTQPDAAPQEPEKTRRLRSLTYVPRIYGFRVHGQRGRMPLAAGDSRGVYARLPAAAEVGALHPVHKSEVATVAPGSVPQPAYGAAAVIASSIARASAALLAAQAARADPGAGVGASKFVFSAAAATAESASKARTRGGKPRHSLDAIDPRGAASAASGGVQGTPCSASPPLTPRLAAAAGDAMAAAAEGAGQWVISGGFAASLYPASSSLSPASYPCFSADSGTAHGAASPLSALRLQQSQQGVGASPLSGSKRTRRGSTKDGALSGSALSETSCAPALSVSTAGLSHLQPGALSGSSALSGGLPTSATGDGAAVASSGDIQAWKVPAYAALFNRRDPLALGHLDSSLPGHTRRIATPLTSLFPPGKKPHDDFTDTSEAEEQQAKKRKSSKS